jgi:tripartite-type tricarboxylate transporter receptor subunit TctC
MKRIFAMAASAVILILGANIPTEAADYPTKPIKIICPFAAGGSVDMVSRAFASVADKHMGQPIVVVNKPGANGMIGELEGITAKPDGYSLTMRATSMSTTLEWEKLNGRKTPYLPEDFIHLGAFTLDPTLVVVPYDSPWNTMDDMVKACKAKPNFYRFGSGSTGTSLPGFVLMKALGIKVRHVPYNGGGPLLAALTGGHVDFSGQWPSTSIPLAQGKKIKILAVQGESRLKAIPDIPIVGQLGIKGTEWEQWIGLAVPKNTSQDIVDKLRGVTEKVAKDGAFVKIIETAGGEVVYMDGPAMTKRIPQEAERIAVILKELLETGEIKKD